MDAILILNASFNSDGRITSWSFLPDNTWKYLAYSFAKYCDKIGFRYMKNPEELKQLLFFDELNLQPAFTEVIKDSKKILLCEYDSYTAYLLGETSFNSWSILDDTFKTDEIYFAQKDKIKILANPSEGIIHFFSVSLDFLQEIEKSNIEFKKSIYQMKNGKILNF